jgi:hypothetical protein
MEPKLGVLIIHGVGSHKKDFAKPIIKKLGKRISDNAKISWHPIQWEPELVEHRESQLLRGLLQEIKRTLLFKSLGRHLRELVINGIGDVTAYRSIPNISGHTRTTNEIYDEIHGCVHKHILTLREILGNADKPVIVMAHSLGSVIMSDYIYDRQKKQEKHEIDPFGNNKFERMETLAGFITFGSPIPLFTVGYDPVESIKFPPENLPDNLKEKAKWLNFYDAHDLFGWPLKRFYGDCASEDEQINVGSILTSWNPLCHHEYWTDNNFTEPVAKYISAILKVCP